MSDSESNYSLTSTTYYTQKELNTELVLAAGRGEYDAVQRVLEAGANIKTRRHPPLGRFNSGKAAVTELDESNEPIRIESPIGNPIRLWNYYGGLPRTALQAAADGGHLDVVKLLVDGGSEVNVIPHEYLGRTPLQAASEGGYLELTAFLITAGADVNAPGAPKNGRTALQGASEGGHEDVVQLLLNHKADLNAPASQSDGRTALQAASAGGNVRVVELLLKHGADVNEPAMGDSGRTALQAAAEQGHEGVVQVLLRAGADVSIMQTFGGGAYALAAAAGAGHENLVNLLLRQQANVNLGECYGGLAALQKASEGGYKRVVQLLLDHNAGAHLPTDTGRNGGALQLAGQGGHLEIVQLLLNYKANVNAYTTDHRYATALHAAVGEGHEDVARVLLDHGASANIGPPKYRHGVLWTAANRGDDKMVQLLLDHNADVNSRRPIHRKGYQGSTALQVASAAGHEEVVRILLNHKADVDALPPRSGVGALGAAAAAGHEGIVKLLLHHNADVHGRNDGDREPYGPMAPLQLAAEGGHYGTVQILLDAKANVNQPATAGEGKTALQAAAEGENELVVKLLLDNGADVNAPAAEDGGRTALQAAAGAGQLDIVKLLLAANADLSAPTAPRFGRTALEAAAGAGNEHIVRLLLDLKADANETSEGSSGRTALDIAARDGHEEVVRLLLDAGATIRGTRDNFGQNVLHGVCREGHIKMLRLLLENIQDRDLNARDGSGSTPPHIAVRSRRPRIVKALLDKNANKEIQDTSGHTPLQVAIQNKSKRTIIVLLSSGASTDRVPTSDVQVLLGACGSKGDKSLAILCSDPVRGRYIEGVDDGYYAINWSNPYLLSPSVCFRSPTSSSPDDANGESFVFPDTFLPFSHYRDQYQHLSAIHWAWSTLDYKGSSNFVAGIPNNQDIVSLRPSEVVLVGYVRFEWPPAEQTATGTPSRGHDPTAFDPFTPTADIVEISWYMRQAKGTTEESGYFLQSAHYRGTFTLKNLTVPLHGVQFVTMFLADVNERWTKLTSSAKLHLAAMRDSQLTKAGEDPQVIRCLLKDSREWSRLRSNWGKHLSDARELLSQFKEHDVLYTELLPLVLGSQEEQEPRIGDIEKLEPIIRLSKTVDMLERNIGNAILDLDKETKELIELVRLLKCGETPTREPKPNVTGLQEFNLVSIYEARRSIEMSTSMKRLSWITFIFLPLMFVTGLFGMNVNLLEENPAWQWYLIVAGPFLTLVLGIWILCKYLPITSYVEQHIGERLKTAFLRFTSQPKSSEPASAQQKEKDSTNGGPVNENDPRAPVGASAKRPSIHARVTGRLRQRRKDHSHDLERAE